MRLSGITIFPVKALQGRACSTAAVEPWGLAGDRRYVITDPGGRFLTQRDCPALATLRAEPDRDGIVLSSACQPPLWVPIANPEAKPVVVTVWRDSVPARSAGAAADAWLEAALGRPCNLAYMADPGHARPADPTLASAEDRVSFADAFPILVTSTASLDDLNRRLPAPVGMDRFRANLVVEGAPAWTEDAWRTLRIGSVLFQAVKPCSRCVVITTDQRTGTRDPGLEPIRTLQRFRRDAGGAVIFGQNLVPRSGGRVAVGDPVEVLVSEPRDG